MELKFRYKIYHNIYGRVYVLRVFWWGDTFHDAKIKRVDYYSNFYGFIYEYELQNKYYLIGRLVDKNSPQYYRFSIERLMLVYSMAPSGLIFTNVL